MRGEPEPTRFRPRPTTPKCGAGLTAGPCLRPPSAAAGEGAGAPSEQSEGGSSSCITTGSPARKRHYRTPSSLRRVRRGKVPAGWRPASPEIVPPTDDLSQRSRPKRALNPHSPRERERPLGPYPFGPGEGGCNRCLCASPHHPGHGAGAAAVSLSSYAAGPARAGPGT